MLYRSIGGLYEYNNIFNYGYGCQSTELFSGNYWKILFKVFLGLKNKYLKSVSNTFVDVDVIHITDNPLFSFPVLKFFLKHSDVKIIYTIHDPSPHVEIQLQKKIIRYFTLFFQNAINNLSINNPVRLFVHIHSEKLLTNYLVKNRNIIIEPHPLSLVNFDVEDVFNISDKFIVSFVARVEYYKGIDILLTAIHKLDKYTSKEQNFKLIIAGKGNFKFSIPKTKNIEIIYINRYISNYELDSIIKYSKLIILPYRDSSSSGVLTRVVAFNTPVIVSNKGCLPDYVEHGVNGFVFNNSGELDKLISKSISFEFKCSNQNFDPKKISLNIINKILSYESSQITKTII